jgi:Archaeal Type IV pilin, N-terminal
VSDVVGTILLLALTVTLFSSIFFFVSTFPTPPPQPSNQFSAYLAYTVSGTTTKITGVTILHLAGPAVPGSSLIYLYSSAQPTRFTAPFTVAVGTNSSANWNLGQNWYLNLTSYGLTVPDNITISLVTSTELLFRTTLPGSVPDIPPTFTATGTIPAVPNVGQAFTAFVQISDNNLNPNSVFVNLSLLPGSTGTGKFKMTFSASLGAYTYAVPAGFTTGSGAYYVFVNATDSSGLKNSVAFVVTLQAAESSLSASIQLNNSAPVSNQSVLVTAIVSNGGTSATTVAVAFSANGGSIGSGGGSVVSGGYGAYTVTWTPTHPGIYLLSVLANGTGGVVSGATFNITVFPNILFIAHNVPSGVRSSFNESSFMQAELTSDGFPFTSEFISCTSALPGSFTGYQVVVIDFGSTWVGGCPKFPAAASQTSLTSAGSGVAFLAVGANAWGSTTCSSFSLAYYALFGVTGGSSGTCNALPNATGAATYTATAGVGLLANGIPASMNINKTLGASSNFVPYDSFKGSTNTAFLKVAGNAVGTYKSSSGRDATIGADPALIAGVLPNANDWGTGQAGASILYNVVNFLCYLSTATQTGRALSDFGVAQATLVGQSHARISTIYVGVRDNGPITGLVTATLYVNGTIALYGGIAVSASVTVTNSGGINWITLTWIAPGSGPYTLSAVVNAPYVLNFDEQDNQMPLNPIGQPTTFS